MPSVGNLRRRQTPATHNRDGWGRRLLSVTSADHLAADAPHLGAGLAIHQCHLADFEARRGRQCLLADLALPTGVFAGVLLRGVLGDVVVGLVVDRATSSRARSRV
jgi:hypothetical protein